MVAFTDQKLSKLTRTMLLLHLERSSFLRSGESDSMAGNQIPTLIGSQ